MHYKNREEQPKVFRQPTLIYPVTIQELPNGRGSVTDNWTSMPGLDFKRSKEAIVSYSMPSPFMKQINSWTVCNRIIPKDWIELVNSVLEPGPQLYWSIWIREAAKIIGQWNKARGRKISQNQILGEGDYVTMNKASYI